MVAFEQHIKVLALLANGMLEVNDFEAAVDIYRFITSQEPKQSRWRIGLVYSLLGAKDLERARIELRSLERMATVPTATKQLLRRGIDNLAIRARSGA